MAMDKPYSPSCERNRDPIIEVLRIHFAEARGVLEIGSGTGQHAVHFAAAMPWLRWQCTDRAEHLPGIRAWLDEAALPNTPAPVELDVAHGSWPSAKFDAVFTANTLHIMGWEEVEALFAKLPHLSAADRNAVERSVERIINKLLHPPLESLRDEAQHGPPHGLVDALKRLFQLTD